MVNFFKRKFILILLLLVIALYYSPFFIHQKVPIPSDTIVGIYHPFRDFLSKDYPRGYPFKNFLITDPVRQTYIWKELVISIYERFELPIWNPYEMAGKPLLANFQSAVFYPLNLFLFIKPFYFSWSIFIISQSILGGLFMFLYLKNLRLNSHASFLGGVAFIFSGFFVSWLEWGNIAHTIIWLPLMLLSINKLLSNENYKIISSWSVVLLVSIICSFFAGHLQVFAYTYLLVSLYFYSLWFYKKDFKILGNYVVVNLFFVIITSFQWIPTLQFINLSARNIDQNYLTSSGFFIPIAHLIQFIAPDFFGNPVTLNYWGTWNYGELVGYIGIVPLFFALYSGFYFRKRKIILFYISLIISSLIFSTDNFFAKVPYFLNIPIFSVSQPTRLLAIICFSLCVLSAIGLDFFIKNKNKNKTFLVGSLFLFVIFSVWAFLFLSGSQFLNEVNLEVAKRNFIIPSAIVLLTMLLILLTFYKKTFSKHIILALLVLSIIDQLRFASKFSVFSESKFLYPATSTINFLKQQPGTFRIATIDDRILPPNFSTHYRIQSVEGYDPLYLLSFGEFISASERGKPDINKPFGFNRIITPSNYNSKLFDYLNIKYVLSLNDIKDKKFKLVHQEGETRVYENLNSLPRVYFVEYVVFASDNNDSINKIFENDLSKTAIVIKSNDSSVSDFEVGKVKILNYSEDKILLETENIGQGFLVISDAYYPTWRVKIDDRDGEIVKTNYSFRGVIVPAGKHIIKFYTSLF